MAYITEDDLHKYLTEQQFETVSRTFETTGIDYVSKAISEAQNYVHRRLNYKYDMDTEFAKTDTNRDETLIRVISIIAIYYLTMPFDLLDQEGKYYQQYQEALGTLDKIESGTMLSDYLTFRDEDKQQILFGKSEENNIQY
jgi:hypothetical protein